MAWCDAEHQTLMAAVVAASDHGFYAHALQLAWAMETVCCRRGLWGDMESTQRVALMAAQRLGDRNAQACVQRELAFALIELRRYDEAVSHLHQALNEAEESADLALQARIHLLLSRISGLRGDISAALSTARQALDVAIRANEETIIIVEILLYVGFCLAQQGCYGEAMEFCQRAYSMSSDGDISEANAQYGIGFVHQGLGRDAEAADYYRRAAALYTVLESEYSAARALVSAGDAHSDAGDPASAGDAWTEAQAMLERLHDPGASEVVAKLHAIQ